VEVGLCWPAAVRPGGQASRDRAGVRVLLRAPSEPGPTALSSSVIVGRRACRARTRGCCQHRGRREFVRWSSRCLRRWLPAWHRGSGSTTEDRHGGLTDYGEQRCALVAAAGGYEAAVAKAKAAGEQTLRGPLLGTRRVSGPNSCIPKEHHQNGVLHSPREMPLTLTPCTASSSTVPNLCWSGGTSQWSASASPARASRPASSSRPLRAPRDRRGQGVEDSEWI